LDKLPPMIPYDDLERALARWKAKSQAADASAPNVPPGSNGVSRNPELSGEIDLNEIVDNEAQ
jgi:hypothetical protein